LIYGELAATVLLPNVWHVIWLINFGSLNYLSCFTD